MWYESDDSEDDSELDGEDSHFTPGERGTDFGITTHETGEQKGTVERER